MNMKKLTEKQADRITAALDALGIYKFQSKCNGAKYDAQRNLEGRTHYAEDSTLSYFKGRINHAFVPGKHGTEAGFLYAIYESVGNKPYDSHLNKRAVVFDAFGEVILKTEWTRTTDQAATAFYKWFDNFSILDHYENRISAKVKRMRANATRASKALRGVK